MQDLKDLDYSDVPEDYRGSVRHLLESCLRAGLIASPREVYEAWSGYSESMAAGWMNPPEPYDDGESPWVKTLWECDCEIKMIIVYHSSR